MALVYAGGSLWFDERTGKFKPGTPRDILNRVPKELWPSPQTTTPSAPRTVLSVASTPAQSALAQRATGYTPTGYFGQDKLEDVYRRYDRLAGLVPQAYEAGKVQLNLPKRAFTPGELRTYVGQAFRQTGHSVPVPEARFQTPEQLGQLVQQITNITEPYVRTQEEATRRGFGEALQQLASQWAARGLLASGAAAAQERTAAENLTRQLAEIRAKQLVEAVPYALQYGQLGLQEAGQRFNQQMANLQYQQQALADALRTYLSGMSEEEAQRQFAQNYALQRAQYESQRAQQQLENLRNILGAQTDIAGRLAQLGLSAGQLTGIYGGTPTLEAQRLYAPWAMGMTPAEQMQFVLQAAGLTGQLGDVPTLEAQRLANEQAARLAQIALQAAQLTGQLGGTPTLEAQRFAIDKALQEAQLTGVYGDVPTLAARQLAINKALQEAGLTGVYEGKETLPARQLAINKALQEAGLTGVYEGKETLPAMQAREEIAQRWAQIRGVTPTGEPTIDRIRIETDYALAKAQQDWNRIYQGGMLDLQKLQILSDNAYREGQLKLGVLDTALKYTDQLGYPQQKDNMAKIIDYSQSGGAGMSLRNYVGLKGGSVDYNDATQTVTVNVGGKTISFKSGQGDAYGIGSTVDANGNIVHYISDPIKFNAAVGGSSSSGGSSRSSSSGGSSRSSSSGGSSRSSSSGSSGSSGKVTYNVGGETITGTPTGEKVGGFDVIKTGKGTYVPGIGYV